MAAPMIDLMSLGTPFSHFGPTGLTWINVAQ